MPDRNQLTYLIGIGAIVTTLALGTCSTNARIDDIAARIGDVHRRIDDTNRHLIETNRRIDDLQDDTNRRFDDVQDELQELRRLVETGQGAN